MRRRHGSRCRAWRRRSRCFRPAAGSGHTHSAARGWPRPWCSHAHTAHGALRSQNPGKTQSGKTDHHAELECCVIPGGGSGGMRGLLLGREVRLPRHPAPTAPRRRVAMTQHVVI
ncbi:hypothetical protein E2C01_012418 [Portunus trituberculatus]|uniref:Uncharacterized protein n=1 Tax=Portunus trituberculatus TaxID=210409 RepID=A0A5B7DE06_PORTR|nr:hypothetical protein [Portunus trituberculatus]